MRSRFGWMGVAAVIAATTASVTLAQTRGLTVNLRANEARDAPVAAEVALYGASHALVIGIDDYRNGWPRRSGAVRDAEAVAEELRRHGFDVTMANDLGGEALDRTLKEFFVAKGADPEARLVVWFGGHGQTLDHEGFLVPADAPPPDDAARFKLAALSMRRFEEYAGLARAKHAFAVFDAGLAGTVFDPQRALPPMAVTRATALPVRQFLTASGADQTVSDDGAFRGLFVRALRGEDYADLNADGYITASEIGLFLADRMSTLTLGRQTPRYGRLRDKDWNRGDVVFQVVGAAAVAAPAPDGPEPSMRVFPDIREAQRLLEALGYMPGPEDGRLGPRTRRAVQRFQHAHAVPADGRVTPALMAALRAAPVPTNAAAAEPERLPGETFRDCADCPEMVVLPPGRFLMGDQDGGGDLHERPLHGVHIGYRLAVGKYEVTQAEFRALMGGNPSAHVGDRKPVEMVSWDHAKEFVARLGRKTGKTYRLLTEAEWEYAARAGSETAYPWGDSIDPTRARFGGNDGAAEVGSYPPNAFGLHDMIGNVWELLEDCRNDTYDDAPADGSAWMSGDLCGYRMVRGGGWKAPAEFARVAFRSYEIVSSFDSVTGFRVARALD